MCVRKNRQLRRLLPDECDFMPDGSEVIMKEAIQESTSGFSAAEFIARRFRFPIEIATKLTTQFDNLRLPIATRNTILAGAIQKQTPPSQLLEWFDKLQEQMPKIDPEDALEQRDVSGLPEIATEKLSPEAIIIRRNATEDSFTIIKKEKEEEEEEEDIQDVNDKERKIEINPPGGRFQPFRMLKRDGLRKLQVIEEPKKTSVACPGLWFFEVKLETCRFCKHHRGYFDGKEDGLPNGFVVCSAENGEEGVDAKEEMTEDVIPQPSVTLAKLILSNSLKKRELWAQCNLSTHLETQNKINLWTLINMREENKIQKPEKVDPSLLARKELWILCNLVYPDQKDTHKTWWKQKRAEPQTPTQVEDEYIWANNNM